ncbi:MAG: hypothetical protein HC927_01275 [Deltaproteobacteria bacterium]|nr:hypothetical protein [Deltaproteobacteria bacterium]
MSGELAQNCYLENNPPNAKTRASLLGTPGLLLFGAYGAGPIRGLHMFDDHLYVVSGRTLYRVRSNSTYEELGTVEGTGTVQMINNGNDVAITTGETGYFANRTDFGVLDEVDLIGATYQDGYGIFAKRGTEQFYISALPEGDGFRSISALAFSSADAFPDKLVGLVSDHRELWLFGKESIEVWQNAGLASFPFVRAGSGFMERGCGATHSIAKDQNRVFWLGDDLRVYTASGYQPQPISTPAIDYQIGRQNAPEAARGFIYQQEGHHHYVLTFQTATFAYDLTTGLWHSRKSHGIDRWRADGNVFAWGKQLVGDYSSGNIYELDQETYSENGEILERVAIGGPIHNNGNRTIMDEFFLDLDMGMGLTAGQGSDPQLILDWSDDGLRTWSNRLMRSAGEIGEYGKRARWHGLGAFRQRSLRVAMTDPVPFRLHSAYWRGRALQQ